MVSRDAFNAWIAVYMMSNRRHGAIYTGVTSNLFRRGHQHLDGTGSAFAARHRCNILVWYETFAWVTDAIQRETSLKRWNRAWKMQLIEQEDPDWLDLYPALCGTAPDPRVKPEGDEVETGRTSPSHASPHANWRDRGDPLAQGNLNRRDGGDIVMPVAGRPRTIRVPASVRPSTGAR